MGLNVAQKILKPHVLSGMMEAGKEIGIRIDQTLKQDATGTLVMLESESMGLDRSRTELSCQYVDHNLIQEDHKNSDDHLFLLSACQRLGIWFSRPEMPAVWGSDSWAAFPIGSQPKMSSWRCSVVTRQPLTWSLADAPGMRW